MSYRFDCYQLGPQVAGSRVFVRLRGTAANVMLLDAPNLARYRSGEGFKSTGQFVRRSPVELTVPRDGEWYLVLDHGGYAGRVRVQELTVTPPDGDESHETQHVVASGVDLDG
jgi:hypothetical protein